MSNWALEQYRKANPWMKDYGDEFLVTYIADMRQQPLEEFTDYIGYKTPERGDFGRGVASGVAGLGGMYGGMKAFAGEALDSDMLRESGVRSMQEAQAKQRLIGQKATDEWSGADSWGDKLAWLKFNAGQTAVNLGESAAWAGAGALTGGAVLPAAGARVGLGVAGKELAKQAAKRYGAHAGMALSAGYHGTGETMSRAAEEAGYDLSKVDMGRVVPAALAHTGLEYFGDYAALKAAGVLRGGVPDNITHSSYGRGLGRNVGREMLGVTAKEVPVEMSQGVAERYAAGLPLDDAKAWEEYGNAGMAASLFGLTGVRSGWSAHNTQKLYDRAHESSLKTLQDTNAPPEARIEAAEFMKRHLAGEHDAAMATNWFGSISEAIIQDADAQLAERMSQANAPVELVGGYAGLSGSNHIPLRTTEGAPAARGFDDARAAIPNDGYTPPPSYGLRPMQEWDTGPQPVVVQDSKIVPQSQGAPNESQILNQVAQGQEAAANAVPEAVQPGQVGGLQATVSGQVVPQGGVQEVAPAAEPQWWQGPEFARHKPRVTKSGGVHSDDQRWWDANRDLTGKQARDVLEREQQKQTLTSWKLAALEGISERDPATPEETAPKTGAALLAGAKLTPLQRKVLGHMFQAAQENRLDDVIDSVGGLQYEKIGEALGIARGSVKSAVKHALDGGARHYGVSVPEFMQMALADAVPRVEAADETRLGLSPDQQVQRLEAGAVVGDTGAENASDPSMGVVGSVGGSQANINSGMTAADRAAEARSDAWMAAQPQTAAVAAEPEVISAVEARRDDDRAKLREMERDLEIAKWLRHPEAKLAADDWNDFKSDAAPEFSGLTEPEQASWIQEYVTALQADDTIAAIGLAQAAFEKDLPDTRFASPFDSLPDARFSESDFRTTPPKLEQAYRDDVEWKNASEENGFPVWESKHVALTDPVESDDDFYVTSPEETIVKYLTRNPAGVEVGFLKVVLEDGWPTAILDIETYKPHRNNGYGRNLVAAILADVGELRLCNVDPAAVAWWEKTGGAVGGISGTLSFATYADARTDKAIQSQKSSRVSGTVPASARDALGDHGRDSGVGKTSFSEGQKHRPSTASEITASLKRWFFSPEKFNQKVTVVQSTRDLPAGARPYLSQAKNPERVQGFVTPDGHTYLVADNIAQGRELAVFLHELGGHIGLPKLLGADNYRELVGQIYLWANASTDTPEHRIARTAMVRTQQSSSADKDSELVAYFIEEAVDAGVGPTPSKEVSGPLAAWFRKLWASVKEGLRKIGMGRFDQLTAQNIVDLAYGAAKIELGKGQAQDQSAAVKFGENPRNAQASGEKKAFSGDRQDVWNSHGASWRSLVARTMPSKLSVVRLREAQRVTKELAADGELEIPIISEAAGQADPELRRIAAGAQQWLMTLGFNVKNTAFVFADFPENAAGDRFSGVYLHDINTIFLDATRARQSIHGAPSDTWRLLRTLIHEAAHRKTQFVTDSHNFGYPVSYLAAATDQQWVAAVYNELAAIADSDAAYSSHFRFPFHVQGHAQVTAAWTLDEALMQATVVQVLDPGWLAQHAPETARIVEVILNGSENQILKQLTGSDFRPGLIRKFLNQGSSGHPWFRPNELPSTVTSSRVDSAGAGEKFSDAQPDAGRSGVSPVSFSEAPEVTVTPAKVEKFPLLKKALESTFGETGKQIYADGANFASKAARSLMALPDLVEEVQGRLPAAKDWYRSLMNLTMLRQRYAEAAETVAADAADLGETELKAVNTFIKRSTREQKWGYDAVFAAREVKADPGMAKLFRDLSPKGQALVKAVFAHGEKMADEKARLLKELGLESDFVGQGRLEGPYAPLKRFGDYVTVFKSKELRDAEIAEDETRVFQLKSDGQHYHVAAFDTRGAAEKFADANRSKWFFADSFEKTDRVMEDVVPQATLQKVLSAVRADKKGMPPEAQAAMVRLVQDMYVQSLAEHHARTSALHRKGTDGADDDMLRSFLHGARAQANWFARLRYGGDVNDGFYQMQRDVKDKTTGHRVNQDEFNILAKHHIALLENVDTPWQDRFTAFTSAWQLATSPAYHLTNMMQGFMVTLPKLAADFNNYSGAWDAMMNGYRVLREAKWDWKHLKSFDVSQVRDAGLRGALQQAADMGVLDVGLDENLTRFEAIRSGYAPVDQASGLVKAALHKLRRVSSTVETANRVSTVSAAYQMARNAGKSVEEAQQYAVRVLQQTQGDYSRTASALILKRLPKVMTQYKKYQFMMAALYTKAFRQAFFGASAEEKALGRRMLIYKLGHTGVMAGLLGMPLMNLAAMVAALSGDDDEPVDLERLLREKIGDDWIADALLKGVPAALGLDAHQKLGEENTFSILPFTDIDMTSRSGVEKAVYGLAGPFVSLLGKGADGVGYLLRGDYYKGLEKMLPRGFESGMKAFRLANEGFTMKNGDILMRPEDMDALAIASEAVGFSGRQVKRLEWLRGQQYEIDTFYKERSAQIRRDYVRAAHDRDTAKMAEAREEWQRLQAGKDHLRRWFSNAPDALKKQPLSTLLKAPQEAQKREKKAQATV